MTPGHPGLTLARSVGFHVRVPIPSPRPRPWYVKDKWPATVGLALGAAACTFSLVADIFAKAPSPPKITASAIALVSVVALGALKIAQSTYKDAREDRKESPDDLRGCLHVIYRAVAGRKRVQDPGEGWLRVTVYSVRGEALEQVVAYVGGDEGNPERGAGRTFSARYGLIGKIARAGEMRAVDRPMEMPFEKWVRYLVDETGMDQLEAQRTRPDRHAFLGVPIKGPDQAVRAVVYRDAGEPGFFDVETAELVAAGCLGLANWVDERYYRA
jgi:hypothetical protein